MRTLCSGWPRDSSAYKACISTLHTPERLPLQILLRICIGGICGGIIHLLAAYTDPQRRICGGINHISQFYFNIWLWIMIMVNVVANCLAKPASNS